MKKKSNPIWKGIFILLLTVNIIFISGVVHLMAHRGSTADLTGLVVLPLVLSLAIIDIITVLLYIFTHHPLGKARFIWDGILIVLISMLIFFGMAFMDAFIPEASVGKVVDSIGLYLKEIGIL